MKSFFSVVGSVVLGFAVLFGLAFGGNYLGYLNYSFFAPKMESVRRETMIQSRAYSEGEIRNLYRMKVQFDAAPSPEAKQTLRLAAQHECEAFDRLRLPLDLANFCNPNG